MTASSLRFFSLQHLVQGSSLRQGAREAVQDHAVLAVGLLDALGDDTDDDLVGHQLALLHDRLGLDADLGAGLHGRAQHLARGELNQPPAGRELLGLGSLARPRRPQQDHNHSASSHPEASPS